MTVIQTQHRKGRVGMFVFASAESEVHAVRQASMVRGWEIDHILNTLTLVSLCPLYSSSPLFMPTVCNDALAPPQPISSFSMAG